MDSFARDYFLFTLFASLGVVLVSIAANPSSRLNFLKGFQLNKWWGLGIIVASYLWFFLSETRAVQSSVEGAQLFFIFAVSALLVMILSRLLAKLRS